MVVCGKQAVPVQVLTKDGKRLCFKLNISVKAYFAVSLLSTAFTLNVNESFS